MNRNWIDYLRRIVLLAGTAIALLGLTAGRPLRITKIVPAPKRFVNQPATEFRADSLRSIRLTYDQNNLFIYFEGAAPGEKYLYGLRNLFHFEIATVDSFAFLPNVPSGEYVFTVRRESDPVGQEARQSLVLEAPVWLRWWFLPVLFGYGVIFISVVLYFVFKYRYRQQLRLIQLREHVARDLHDDMGSQLSSLSILSQNVQQLAQRSPELAQKSVEKIGETARQVMDTMSEIVWNVNPENDSLARIVERMKDFGGELFDLTDTELIFETDEEVLKATLPMEKRRDFFLIFKEALTNAARYAQASTVLLRTEYHHGALRLTIRDDGQGFDPAQPPRSKGGNGLKNMRARAEKIGAELEISSAPHQGTTLILQLPLS